MCILAFTISYGTEFTMTITFENQSDNWKRIKLEKGRILELAEVDASEYQSIVITEGDGVVLIPPQETVERRIKGMCLHKGLKFPKAGRTVTFTPFVGNDELITDDQKKIHSLTEHPAPIKKVIIAKGYSDDKKNGKMTDRDEAVRNAMENATMQAGIDFESETIMKNISKIKDFRKLAVKEKSVRLTKIIHEEYKSKTGEYLFIGEFEVTSQPPEPEIDIIK